MLWHLSKLRWTRASWTNDPDVFIVFSQVVMWGIYRPARPLGSGVA